MTYATSDIFQGRPFDVWLVLDSSGFGGIESHVATLAASLTDHGFKTLVVFLSDHGGLHPLAERLKREEIPCLYSKGSAGLIDLLRCHAPKVVHSHGYKANIVSRIAACLFGLKSVSTFHAGDPGKGRVRAYTAIDEATSFLSARVAVSNAIASRLPYTSAVIENFVPLPAAVEQEDRAGVAFVGRLSHEKGADRFCRMADRVRAKSDTSFHIFGDGPMRAELEAKHPSLRFHGAVRDLDQRLAKLKLLVMPSRAEGLPMAALEAMSASVPIIATSVGGLPDLIIDGHNGWLTANDDDVSNLADRVGEVLNLSEEDLQAVGLAARRMIEHTFSPERILPKILQVYGLEESRQPQNVLCGEIRRV